MYFKVYDRDEDITDAYQWVITPDGKIRYVDYYGPIIMKGIKAVLCFNDGHSKVYTTVIVNERERGYNMYFKVFDKDGKDITNNYSWVITQQGEIRYWDYGDLTGMEGAKAVLYFDNGHTETFVSPW